MQYYCQFCHQTVATVATPQKRLGGPYFCSEIHAMKFFRGEDYVPPQTTPATPPFFMKREGPRLIGKEVIAV